MKEIELKAFAKINLSLDVKGLLDNGYHRVEMVMQQILLCDDVLIRWREHPLSSANRLSGSGNHTPDAGHAPSEYTKNEGKGSDVCHSDSEHTATENAKKIKISLSTDKSFLPTDKRNLAYKAALIMAERFGNELCGHIYIDIKKRIPVAAGLAGGSSNAAAVIHGLNMLWQLNLPLKELCSLGSELGSDIPFCIMGQAAANDSLKDRFASDPLTCHCALATGRGTELTPVAGLKSHLVLSKPPISVSTAEVYRGIDDMKIPLHPDNAELIRGLESENLNLISKNFVNVLENFTLKRYPIVMYTKNILETLCGSEYVLMSGSGPTVFGLCSDPDRSKKICSEMLKHNKESFRTRTTW